ncbi:MAG: hypothetical protein ACXAC2_03685 [Candidatus Kariarchaeaceae archaeon]|jgi:hypothetical protein
MKINDKLILHTNCNPHIKTDKIDQFVIVTIVKIRNDVPGDYGSKNNTGYRAKDEDGNDYKCNWTSFPDAVGPGGYVPAWHGNSNTWYDVTRVRNAPGLPKGFEDSFILYCEEHKTIYYENEECFDCSMKKIREKKTAEKMAWNGW